MPTRAPTPCRHPGCAALLSTPGYCDSHQSDSRQWDTNAIKRQRQKSRALPTNSASWRRIRAHVLREEPTCRRCALQGIVRAANVVDHIDGDSHNNGRDNLQSICSRCHSVLTAKHDGGFGNPTRRRNADVDT